MQLTVKKFLILPEEQLDELTSLNFWCSEEATDEDLSLLSDDDFTKLCELLAASKQLFRLELCDNNIGNLGLAKIAQLTAKIANCIHLEILDLSNNNLNFLELETWVVLIENLARSSSLATIILHDNKLGTLEHKLLTGIFDNLAKINLKKLDLAWNELGNNQALGLLIDKIDKYPALNNLDLSNNNLGEDYIEFSRLFYNLHQIKVLNLSKNNLGLMSQHFNLDGVISHNLEVLDLSNNELGHSEQIFIFMMEQARLVKELNLSNNKLELLGNKFTFSNYENLEVLKLADHDLSKFKEQSIIELIACLSRFDNLKELDLSRINLFDLSISNLHNLFDMLINNNQLRSLNLADNKLSITKVIPRLSDLLKQNKLIKLDLSDNLLSVLTNSDWEHLLSGLAASSNLKTLNISSNDLERFSTERIINLSQTLKKCYHLEKLNLGDQSFAISDLDKLQILFTALSELPNLKKLDLRYTMEDCLVEKEGMDILSKFIGSTTSLQSLKLELNRSEETEQQLKETLKNKPWFKLKFS